MAPVTSRELRPRKKAVAMMAPVTSRELRPRKKAVATAKGCCAVFTTTRRNKEGGISTTTTRKKRVAQASNIQPDSDHNKYVESDSDHDNVNEPGSDDDSNVESGSDDDNNVESVSRDTSVVEAKLIAEKVKLLTQKTLEGLETFLRRKGMSTDGPYKDAIQKLKKGEKIDDKVGARIARYIYLLLRGFRAFVFALARVKDWDDEIVGEIIEFIKRKLNEHLEVEVQEVQELLKIAEDVRSESDETWKLMKGKRLKNRVVNWMMNTKYLEKTSNDWGKKRTPSFRSFDEDYIDYDQAFPSRQGLFML